MTHKERVIRALEHKTPEVCPWCIGFTIPAARKMAEHYGDANFEARLGNHLATIEPGPPGRWVEVRPGFWRDEFGVVWNRTVDKDIGNPDEYPLADGDLDAFVFPDPDVDERYATLGEFCETHRDDFLMGSIGFSLFERAWTLRGMEQLLVDMVTEAPFVEALLEKIADWNLRVIDRMCAFPFDAIHTGDDWGQQHGLIMGPALWRKFIKPQVKRMYARSKSHGKFVSIHSCGDIREVLGDLVDIGLDMFNPFQPEVMDVEAVKREFGKHLTFHGGISTQRTLPYGTPGDVRAEVRRRIETIGADGGYVCAPAHAIPGDVPVENMVALVEELQSQEKHA
ncbi:MAG TPA: uroporphyrinogen decarboxylase family protein [Planctomycetota bacterium]|nr:uroporphyrinogen decarboxylase family protein [Planctomycetota bacterium]